MRRGVDRNTLTIVPVGGVGRCATLAADLNRTGRAGDDECRAGGGGGRKRRRERERVSRSIPSGDDRLLAAVGAAGDQYCLPDVSASAAGERGTNDGGGRAGACRGPGDALPAGITAALRAGGV